MKTLFRVLLTCSSIVSIATAQYSGGTGEPNDPYRIATAADLIALGETPEDYDKHFILTADIDLDPNLPGGRIFDKAVIAPGAYAWFRSGYPRIEGALFVGTFDGNGKTISHVEIDGGDCLGLFGTIASGAEVKNLGLVAVNITGAGDSVGGLAGVGSATNCHVSGSVSGRDCVGGLLGGGSADHCHSTAAVSGEGGAVGGLLGSGVATHCYSTGPVSGNSGVGGLVGENGGGVSECYSASTVRGSEDVGGLVGRNSWISGYAEESPGEIANCYSTGNVEGSDHVGGLVGHNRGSVTNCYATGVIRGTGSVGGLVGYSDLGEETACFWDIETSGQTTSAGGTGLTTAEMQTLNTFLDAGWDFIGETANGTDDIWWILEGKDYPRLWWEAALAETQNSNIGARNKLK